MKNLRVKYHKTIAPSLRAIIENLPEYNPDAEYHVITVGDYNNPEAFIIIESADKKLHIVDILVKGDEQAAAIVFRLILIAAITRNDITYRRPVFHPLLERVGAPEKVGDIYYLRYRDIKRYIKIGSFPTGKNNKITDVSDVAVGHFTLESGEVNTGITAVLPHRENIFREKVYAGSHVFNGFGKSLGLIQIEELGTIETPILLTNTLSVGAVADGLISYMLKLDPAIADTTGTVNPLILECNDGYLNDIRALALTKKDVYKALEASGRDFEQGAVGAGTGMRCLGFKGGIGSSSRVIEIAGKPYTLGVLVNSNFQGGSYQNLRIKGRNVGELLTGEGDGSEDQGSIIVVIATDLPLDARQLKRVARRAELGIGNTGGFASHGSGDIIVAFSVADRYKHFPEEPVFSRELLHDEYLNHVFRATVEATEEAIINSMLFARPVIGYRGRFAPPLSRHIELFDDLLITK